MQLEGDEYDKSLQGLIDDDCDDDELLLMNHSRNLSMWRLSIAEITRKPLGSDGGGGLNPSGDIYFFCIEVVDLQKGIWARVRSRF